MVYEGIKFLRSASVVPHDVTPQKAVILKLEMSAQQINTAVITIGVCSGGILFESVTKNDYLADIFFCSPGYELRRARWPRRSTYDFYTGGHGFECQLGHRYLSWFSSVPIECWDNIVTCTLWVNRVNKEERYLATDTHATMEELRFLCGLFPRQQWADATVDVTVQSQYLETGRNRFLSKPSLFLECVHRN
jgi:hypothetical protein